MGPLKCMPVGMPPKRLAMVKPDPPGRPRLQATFAHFSGRIAQSTVCQRLVAEIGSWDGWPVGLEESRQRLMASKSCWGWIGLERWTQ